ncbi:unnamed protein product [Owenia fusiformis]|uniref:Uncharacterized protein n=1 Tax=Owenia fusiformis TaxID=6347 RepID=A0A8J1Y362_OWEFU|nr:unnamed protein product [Owenia fusiformis]
MVASIYVFYDEANGYFKIGQSVDVGRRLHEVRSRHPHTVEVMRCPVGPGMELIAENSAHSQVQIRLGMQKVQYDQNDSDWFKNPQGYSAAQVVAVVTSAIGQ